MSRRKSKRRLGFRQILSILTVILVALVIFLARDDLAGVSEHIGELNVWILLTLVPVQLLMYYAAGQMYFAYIKARKPDMKIKTGKLMRISLEVNFTNHILPSGGASGLAYLSWRFKEFGITAGQATMMYMLRMVIAVMTTTTQMFVAVIFLAVSRVLPGWLFWISLAICLGLYAGVAALIFVVSSRKRINFVGNGVSKFVNGAARVAVFWKEDKPMVVKPEKLDKFLEDLHRDYDEVRANPKLIIKPYLWGMLYSFIEALVYMITFFALGVVPNIWGVMLAQGVASVVGTVAITPGGAGFYETVMTGYLVAAGATLQLGLLATVVTRVIILLGTIVFGWGFYQHALLGRARKDKVTSAAGG